MASIIPNEANIKSLKHHLRTSYFSDINVKSTHISEALAYALGFKSHAALLSEIKKNPNPQIRVFLHEKNFAEKLSELSQDDFKCLGEYPPFFDDLNCDAIKRTSSYFNYAYDRDNNEYLTIRQKAWNNIMIAAVNAGLNEEIFDLNSPNSWDPNDYTYLFDISSGLKGKATVRELQGGGELEFYLLISPTPKAKEMNEVDNFFDFSYGEAWACGYLERLTGAWVQYGYASKSSFRCRKHLINQLASINIKPLGFGKVGKCF